MNLTQRFLHFISQSDQKRTFSILAALAILVSIPLTVHVAQQRQELRQKATGGGSNPKGFLDLATCNTIEGWACDADNYSTPLEINFYKDGPAGEGGTIIGSTRAERQREEAVGSACGGNRNHGFLFNTPETVKDDLTHSIYAYAINILGGESSLLYSSAKTISGCRPTPNPTPIPPTPPIPMTHCNRCSIMYAFQWTDFYSQDSTCATVVPSSSPVTRTCNCSCPSAGLDTSWNPSCVSSCTPTPPTPTPTPTPPPTPTGAQSATQFTFTLDLTGIGQNGNKNPRTTQRQIEVELFDSDNEPLPLKDGTVSFNNTTNLFKGTVDMGSLAAGNYTVKVKTPKYLKRRISGIQTIVSARATPYVIPSITLVVGDANNDNKVNIIDYNMWRDCYQGTVAETSCSNVDFNDDGIVRGAEGLKDGNLLITSLGVKEGD